MPKDATKNIDRYKVRGGQFNEFEYSESQKGLKTKKAEGGAKLIPGTPPEEAAPGLQPVVKATSKATSKARKSTKANKKASPTKGVSAKKLAARKAAAKK
jgi:hypothetical protein